MGADLCLIHFAIPKGQDLNKSKTDMLEEVNRLTPDSTEEIENYFNEVYGNTLLDHYEQEENNEAFKKCIKMAKTEFKRVIKQTFEAIQDMYRDVGILEHKGDLLYISGGMSWGDAPTDRYSLFNKFVCLPSRILERGNIA